MKVAGTAALCGLTLLIFEHHCIPGTENLFKMQKKIKKEKDQTQFLQLFLTAMTQKDLKYILYQCK